MRKKEDVQTVPSIPQQVYEIVRKHISAFKSKDTFRVGVQEDLKRLSAPINLDSAFRIYFLRALQWLELEARRFFDVFYHEYLKNHKDGDGDFRIAYYTLRLLGLEDIVLLDEISSIMKTSPGFTPFSDLRFEFVREVASMTKYDLPILIIGETGTSKELVARAIHGLSDRREKEYFTINCAAYPEGFIEADLFGYERGMVTGGLPNGRIGILEEQAKGGVVFLDELGKMPRPQQAKLLRAIDTHEIRRMGGRKNIKIDVRFIAAIQPKDANRILPDLKYRLGYPDCLHMTPLKERLNLFKGDSARDIIIRALNNVLVSLNLREKLYKITVNKNALTLLVAYDFPGNYRELENILRRAVRRLLAAGRNAIIPDDLSPLGSHASSDQQNIHASAGDVDKIRLGDIIAYAEGVAADIVEKKVASIEANGGDLKNELKKEGGYSDSKYQTFLRQIKKYRQRRTPTLPAVPSSPRRVP